MNPIAEDERASDDKLMAILTEMTQKSENSYITPAESTLSLLNSYYEPPTYNPVLPNTNSLPLVPLTNTLTPVTKDPVNYFDQMCNIGQLPTSKVTQSSPNITGMDV